MIVKWLLRSYGVKKNKNKKLFFQLLILNLFVLPVQIFSQPVQLNQPKIQIGDNSYQVVTDLYFEQQLWLDITNVDFDASAYGTYKWCIDCARSQTIDGLNTAEWDNYPSKMQLKRVSTTQKIEFKTYYSWTNETGTYFKFKVNLYNADGMTIGSYEMPGHFYFRKATMLSNLTISPNNQIKQGERVYFSWNYTPIIGCPDDDIGLFYTIGTEPNFTIPPSGPQWISINRFSSQLNTYNKILIDCNNKELMLGKYIVFKLTNGYSKDVIIQNPIYMGGQVNVNAPQITNFTMSQVSPSTYRLNYNIFDQDNDLNTENRISIVPIANILYQDNSTALIKVCLENNIQYTVTCTANDMQCNSTVQQKTILNLERKRPVDGYDWVTGNDRPKLIDQRFPDLKVYIKINKRPYNIQQGELSNDEIYAAVKLGLYTYASILPQMHVRFVDNESQADFKINLDETAGEGGRSGFWDGDGVGSLLCNYKNVAFRKLDYISPKMDFERKSALYNANKPLWGYYNEDDPNPINLAFSTYNDARAAIAQAGKDPNYVCINWEAVNAYGWENIPYSNIKGTGRGDADLAVIIQHEFGHTLGLDHIDQELNSSRCSDLTRTKEQGGGDRTPLPYSNIDIYIPRAELRDKKLPVITDSTGYSVMLGNEINIGGFNNRGIFDIDADGLSTSQVSNCDCDIIVGNWNGYSVSYPQIRKGYFIVLQNRNTKEKFYTDNWHIAHQKMGWALNNNTKALDTDWFLVDIVDSKGIKPEIVGNGSNADLTTDFNSTSITLKGNSIIGAKADNIVFASELKPSGIIADVRLENANLRGGIMLRQTLASNSPTVYLSNYNSNSIAVYYRSSQGDSGQWLNSSIRAMSQPVYLRIIRYGTTIKAMVSSDGNNFTEIAKVPFPTGNIYVGLCAEGSTTASATFSNYKVKGYDPLTPIINLLLND